MSNYSDNPLADALLERLNACRKELREATEAIKDPRVNLTITLPEAIKQLELERDQAGDILCRLTPFKDHDRRLVECAQDAAAEIERLKAEIVELRGEKNISWREQWAAARETHWIRQIKERDAEVERLTREHEEEKKRLLAAWTSSRAGDRRLLERIENAVAYISRHGHTNDYDWNADPKKLTAAEGEVLEAIRAHLGGGEK